MSIFCDQTEVEFIGGKGGKGALHFHREKFVSKGGPDGGDGGHGGSVILKADQNVNTLVDFNTYKVFKAEEGGDGQKKLMSGLCGKNLILKVPVGTLVKENGITIADLKTHDQEYVVAKGGKGGFGNAHFKSSIHQLPDFAELGEIGQRKKVILELQLVADVGIIGFPSAGKSTLISKISNAKPKIADYPFTTLIPNLGVVKMADYDKRSSDSFVVADIPGLIENAHKGKGLGHKFLRHVARSEILVHLIDPTRDNPEDLKIINKELKSFDETLSTKKQIYVVSKCDVLLEEEIDEFIKKLKKKNPTIKKFHRISSATGEGIRDLIFDVLKLLKEQKKKEKNAIVENNEEIETIFRPIAERKFEVIYRRSKVEAATGKTRKIFDVIGERIEQVVNMTDMENAEGVERIYHFIKKMGIYNELKKKGASAGDRIRIAGQNFKMR